MAQYSFHEIKDILKKKILIERLELDDVEPADISDDENLFDEKGLALDSVEALDIVTGVSDVFKIDTSNISQEDLSTGFQTVDQIASYISKEMS
ncbi:MAG: phosphopantetheine-binding protein [Sporolactobacillus sp.]